MKNSIKYKIMVMALFVLLITVFFIVETYALFETNANGNGELEIGKWVILLNNNDVTETRTITLNDLVYVNGTHTENGYFAPGSQAYFDLEIDASNSDVSIAYQLDIDDSALDEYPNIYFTATNLDSGDTSNTDSYNGLIRLSDSNRVHNIKITLMWDNQLEYDESDTSLIDKDLEFTITANFIQSIAE